MKYLEWNNCISNYFFKPEKAGKDVYLYVTKSDITTLGQTLFSQPSKDQIWDNFLLAVKNGIPGSIRNSTIVDKAVYCFEQWKRPGIKSIDGVDLIFPPYIAYLVFFILPLTEENADFHAGNYHGRLETFRKANLIDNEIGNLQNLEKLWNDLEEWSILATNGDTGFFTLRKFSENRKYVGKFFSQCVFSPSAIKKLPELFFEAKMVPESFYAEAEFKKNLLTLGASILGLKNNILDIIKKSESNEIGQSIIQLVMREYTKWTGESHKFIINGGRENTERNFTVASLLLQFKLNTNDGEIKFSHRMYSSNDYPEDLKFGNFDILSIGKGYSKTLEFPDKSTFQPFDLKDNFNKWVARFPLKNVRLFINASIYQLSADYWIETEFLSKTDRMFLLCTDEVAGKIVEWGKHFKNGNFKLVDDLKGLPEKYSLYSIANPSLSLKDIPILTVYTEKAIKLHGGLRITHRSYLNEFLPEVEIVNSDGNEIVYLQYRNHEEKIFLKKKQAFNNRWLLPEEIICNADFNIRVEDENFAGNDIAYSIASGEYSANKIDSTLLPNRDSFGRKTSQTLNSYSIGSNVINGNLRRQESYKQFFTGIVEDAKVGLTVPLYVHHEGNVLLSFLTCKNISATEDFYSAFEFLHSNCFGKQAHQANINYSKIKKAALNLYDYLGYLDYDYESKQIIVNHSQLILLPVSKGRKALLIGGRDSTLVNSLIRAAPKYDLQVEIVKQSLLNENLLLPDAITIKAYGKTGNFGENNIIALAKELNIAFNPNDIVQVGLYEFSADIEAYEKELLTNNEVSQEDYDWARNIFNPNTLKYERNTGDFFDKSFSLIEYKLNEYRYYHKLWRENKCYSVDKNWGKYLALKHYGKQHKILYDAKKCKVAVPFELPLPRLLAESIVLLSGLAPIYLKIDEKSYRVYENVPSPFIKNLFGKLKQNTREINL